ncbi:Fic family protein [Actinomyces ruminis]|uniref:Fic family protein n=1 Tax=Actinomyces ruminis TaxID=1937003 RepID=UPI00211F2AE2|nr:Fic family protein [Actinomyces ruminis]
MRDAVAACILTEAATGDPSLDVAAGLWRAGVRLTEWMPDLAGPVRPAQPSPRALLTALHRDVAGPLAATGQIPVDAVAIPRAPGTMPLEGGPGAAPDADALRDRIAALLGLIDLPGAPALVRAAVVHGEMIAARPFSAANAAVGRLLVRYLITRDGLEPTGVAVVDQYAGRAPGAYAAAAAAYASGQPDGVIDWILWQAEAILVGIQEAQAICRSVQAGTTAVP